MLGWRDAIVGVAVIVAAEEGLASDEVRRVALTDLTARVAVTEPFGWGLVVTLDGEGVRQLEAVECIDAPAGS